MNVVYGVPVAATAEVDRTAWAALIVALIDAEAGGNQTRFAAKVGVTPRTITRWLEGQVAVRPQSVTEVARALGRSPVELLVRIGYLTSQEVAPAGTQPLDPLMQRWLAYIADPDVPEESKEQFRQMLRLWVDQIEATERVRRQQLEQRADHATS